MDLVSALDTLAQGDNLPDKAFDLVKGIREAPKAKQIQMVQAVLDSGGLDAESAAWLRYHLDEARAGEQITTADNLATQTAQDTQKPAPKEDVPWYRSDAMRAIFPRSVAEAERRSKTGNEGTFDETLGDLGRATLDVFSPLRLAAAAVEAPFSDKSFKELAAQTEADTESSAVGGFAENILRSPLTIPSLLTGGLGAAAASKAIPAGTTLLSNIGRGAIGGSVGATAAAAPVSATQVAAGELTPSEAAGQTAGAALGGAVIGGALPAVGAAFRKIRGRPELTPEQRPISLPYQTEVASGEYRPLSSLVGGERSNLPAPTSARGDLAPRQSQAYESVIDAEATASRVNPKAEGREEALNQMVGDYIGISPKEVAQNLPSYMKNIATNMTDEDRANLQKFFDLEFAAKHADNADQLVSSMQYVAQDLANGTKAMRNARSGAGARMGEIEKAAQVGELDKISLLESWMDILGKRNLRLSQSEDGAIRVTPTEAMSKVSKDDIADMQELVDGLVSANNFSRAITPEQLRNYELAMKSAFSRNVVKNSTRQDVMKTDADVMADEIFKSLANGTRENIKRQLGDEASAEYDMARKAYAKLSGELDYLHRRLGKGIEGEARVPWSDTPEEMFFSARGPNMLTKLFSGADDRLSVGLVKSLKQLTGQDIYRKASLAKYASWVADGERAGAKIGPKKPTTIGGLAGAIKEKVTPKMASKAATLDKLVERSPADVKRAKAQKAARTASAGAMTLPEIFLRPMLLNSKEK